MHMYMYHMYPSTPLQAVFFYMVFSMIASRWNVWRFMHQVKGLDLRDLTRDQFDSLGRLVDTSFQVPRELGQMKV